MWERKNDDRLRPDGSGDKLQPASAHPAVPVDGLSDADLPYLFDCGSVASRKPSPSRLQPSTVTTIARPGTNAG